MDYYGYYLHGLAEDILADQNGYTRLIDVGGEELHIPTRNSDRVQEYIESLGIKTRKKHAHTIMVLDYPENFVFTEEDARTMAKEMLV